MAMLNYWIAAVAFLSTQLGYTTTIENNNQIAVRGLSCSALAADSNLKAYLDTVPHLGLQLGIICILTGTRDFAVTTGDLYPLRVPSSMKVTAMQMNDAAYDAFLSLELELGNLQNRIKEIPPELKAIYHLIAEEKNLSVINQVSQFHFERIGKVENQSRLFPGVVAPKLHEMSQLMQALEKFVTFKKEIFITKEEAKVLKEIEEAKQRLAGQILHVSQEMVNVSLLIAGIMEEIANASTLKEFDDKVNEADGLEKQRSRIRKHLLRYQREYLNVSLYETAMNRTKQGNESDKLKPFIEPIVAVAGLWSQIVNLTVSFGNSVSSYIRLAKGCLQEKVQELNKNFNENYKEATRQYIKKATTDFKRKICIEFIFATAFLETITVFNKLELNILVDKTEVEQQRENLLNPLKMGAESSIENAKKTFETGRLKCMAIKE